MMKFQEQRILLLSAYSIMAVLLFIVESVIPKPLPFMRIGLANVFILLILVQLDFVSALVVTMSKVIIGNLFSGLLFTPFVLFSLVSSLVSLLVMYAVYKSKIPVSLIGVSITGAVSHLLTQLILGYFLFVHTLRIFVLFPIILLIGLVSGLITGILVVVLYKKIQLRTFESLQKY
ncbi:MAG: Gx transporter family protein [Candidatus Cloacimonetes bacterium]|nr:Gx transporter family protein [Candidatus Cloacimonadota bacterium]